MIMTMRRWEASGGSSQQKKGSGFVKPSKDDCAEKAQEIQGLYEELKQRLREMENDVNDFVLRGMTKEIETHVKSFKQLQTRLEDKIKQYDKFCKDKGPPPPDGARELAKAPAPRRVRAPNAPLQRDSRWLWVLPPVMVGIACLVCPECCAVVFPVFAIP